MQVNWLTTLTPGKGGDITSLPCLSQGILFYFFVWPQAYNFQFPRDQEVELHIESDNQHLAIGEGVIEGFVK